MSQVGHLPLVLNVLSVIDEQSDNCQSSSLGRQTYFNVAFTMALIK